MACMDSHDDEGTITPAAVDPFAQSFRDTEERREKGTATTEPAPAPSPDPAPRKPLELPLTAFVKGGTTTTANDRLYDQRYRESEVRRDQSDEDKRIGATPIEQGGGRIYANRFTSKPEIPQAYVRLVFWNKFSELGPMLCEVMIESWNDPSDLTIQLVCPQCVAGGVKHEQDCQLSLKMSNRHWTLLPGVGPREFVFAPAGFAPKVYNSAGVVAESEMFNCPDCNWAGRISNNRVITERC